MTGDASETGPAGAGLSRRGLLTGGAGGSLAVALAADAQAETARPRQRNTRKFRALVVDGRNVSVRELTMLPLHPRYVAVRTEAAGACYTMVGEALNGATPPAPGVLNSGDLYILGHSCVGIVEEVGSMVERVKVGDRVLVPNTPYCGQCYHCMTGASQFCGTLHKSDAPAVATLDGRGVLTRGDISGIGELTITAEETCVPIFTDLAAPELALVADIGSIGLSAAFHQAPIEPGTDVVVQGCGPVGLSAVQGARIKGAAQIIAIEPIKARREAALRMGATVALDPNAEGDGLVEKIRDLCKGPTDRVLSGGRVWTSDKNYPRGADYSIEAVGGDRFKPKVEQGPDPTGVLPLKQAWEYTRAGGHLTCLGVGQPGNLKLDIQTWAFFNRGRTIHPGHMGGMQPMRDLPRYVRLMERGLYDARSLVTRTYSLDQSIQCFQDVADRTVVSGVVTFA